MRILLLALLVGVMTLPSCKKGKADITLKGSVTDATFGGGLSSGTIKIYEVEASSGDKNLVGSQTLTDGSYSFTFPRNAVEKYIIEITKDNYFSQEESIPLSELTIEEDNVRNFSTTAESWAGLRFVTSNPNATLNYTRQTGKSGCETCCPSGTQTIYGAVDTIIYCPNDGNTTYSYNYQVNGLFGIKEATTVAFDTTMITLSY